MVDEYYKKVVKILCELNGNGIISNNNPKPINCGLNVDDIIKKIDAKRSFKVVDMNRRLVVFQDESAGVYAQRQKQSLWHRSVCEARHWTTCPMDCLLTW